MQVITCFHSFKMGYEGKRQQWILFLKKGVLLIINKEQ